MKLLFFLFLIVSSSTSYGTPYTETNTFSEWHRFEDFSELIKSTPRNKFPAIVQAGALLGDGAEYRVLFTIKPSDNFEYHITYGATVEKYTSLNAQYTEAGFILSHRQIVPLRHGLSYQAVWIKNGF